MKEFFKKPLVLINLLLILSVPVLAIMSEAAWLPAKEIIKPFFTNLYTGIVVTLLIQGVLWIKETYGSGGKIKTVFRLLEEVRKENCPKCTDVMAECLKLSVWKLEDITKGRRTFAGDKEKFFIYAHESVDVIAFGLSYSRELNDADEVAKAINKNNISIRIVCPCPNSHTAENQEWFEASESKRKDFKEWNKTQTSIKRLLDWTDSIESQLSISKKGNLQVRKYFELPLFFYMRIDDDIYVGPYMLGKSSKDSITFHFVKGGAGFKYFSDYFETAWKLIGDDSCSPQKTIK